MIFDGITALDLVGPLEAFAIASVSGKPAYETITLGLMRRSCVAERRRVHYTASTAASLYLVWFYAYWNVLGFQIQ